jgi:DNA-binding protein HU-beta
LQKINERKKGSRPVNKNDLVARIAAGTDVSRNNVAAVIDKFVDCVTEALKEGDDLRLVGFGTFHVAERKATTGRNPRTGASIHIPAARVPKFRAGKALKDSIK